MLAAVQTDDASLPPDASEGEDRIAEYVQALRNSARLGRNVVCHRVVEPADAVHAPSMRPWPRALQALLAGQGIAGLYEHQARATDLIRSGRHVVVATPTASGKSLVYNLPVLERFLADTESRSLYLFPLKALAQDQFKAFERLAGFWPAGTGPRAAIYDGDTADSLRRKIRKDPPNVMLTNPEMLHLSICPFHHTWSAFLAGLSFVVVDEVHTYRGVLGSHMAQVFRRLRRICARYGANPTWIFCSATIGNPEELACQLTGLDVVTVDRSGAPQGRRHILFINPEDSPAHAAILLLRAALHRELRVIVYVQSRKMTELICLWAVQKSGRFRDRISAYRAGFLPEERREIEARMSSGELLAVISTSALELGIDIGELDLCLLVGYPGSVMATLQRGGRVGRSQRESAVALIAGEDALDQYFMRNPQDFFDRPPESAVINPDNPVIRGRHLECAAAELPLEDGESWLTEPGVAQALERLLRTGRLLRSKDGQTCYSARKQPQRELNLRGAGAVYHIVTRDSQGSETTIGFVDEHRACKENHPGAVYLHKGQSYVVDDFDPVGRTVRVVVRRTDYYTRTRGQKVTEIIEHEDAKTVWGARLGLGRLKVTETVTGYEKRSVRGGKLLSIVPLDLPPLTFETQGLWFEIPRPVQLAVEKAFLHFMGGIHALEHAAIGILPLLVMTDRNDLGGISTPMHAQIGLPAVFIYDGVPGGVGLSRLAFARAEELFARTLQIVRTCPCEFGCPSCVHSPKCGSGNRPIDKAAALFILEALRDLPAPETPGERIAAPAAPETTHAPTVAPLPPAAESAPSPPPALTSATQRPERSTGATPLPTDGSAEGDDARATTRRYGVLDVETQLSAEQVGGWRHADKMRVSVAVLYDATDDSFHVYQEDELDRLFARLTRLDLVVGFNINRFDYAVLQPYTTTPLRDLPTLDMLETVRRVLNYRLSLDKLAAATLGTGKSADGLQALRWWSEGRVQEIITYCTQDVGITRDLYLYGRRHGYVLFTNKAGKVVRLPVDW